MTPTDHPSQAPIELHPNLNLLTPHDVVFKHNRDFMMFSGNSLYKAKVSAEGYLQPWVQVESYLPQGVTVTSACTYNDRYFVVVKNNHDLSPIPKTWLLSSNKHSKWLPPPIINHSSEEIILYNLRSNSDTLPHQVFTTPYGLGITTISFDNPLSKDETFFQICIQKPGSDCLEVEKVIHTDMKFTDPTIITTNNRVYVLNIRIGYTDSTTKRTTKSISFNCNPSTPHDNSELYQSELAFPLGSTFMHHSKRLYVLSVTGVGVSLDRHNLSTGNHIPLTSTPLPQLPIYLTASTCLHTHKRIYCFSGVTGKGHKQTDCYSYPLYMFNI